MRPETPPLPDTVLIMGLVLCGVALTVCLIEFFFTG
jgi:hypothetical protein